MFHSKITNRFSLKSHMNLPLSKLICGLQVYCLIQIINLLMGASLLTLAKSIYITFPWH